MKPYIQPFEKKLALTELAAISKAEPEPLSQKSGACPSGGRKYVADLWSEMQGAIDAPDDDPQLAIDTSGADPFEYEIETDVPAEILIEKLAYWEYVSDGKKSFTTQVVREATVNLSRGNVPLEKFSLFVPFKNTIPLPKRRCLRYGTHGIHEYRGKFFPQLVRSLLNIAQIPTNGIVLDPTCGSGTTLVEAALSGFHGSGLDLNPLSVLISKTKCALLSVPPTHLLDTYQQLKSSLLQASQSPDQALPYFSQLLATDQAYLREWFSEQVLLELDLVASHIHSLTNDPTRDFMRLSLSNIIRHVSWQKEADLRVRKEIKDDENIHPIEDFLAEVDDSMRILLPFLYQNRGKEIGTFEVQEGSAVNISNLWRNLLGRVDVVITSPPYATALPYLETDRLSLYYLGLLSRAGHRARDLEMIGNREISDAKRKAYWDLLQAKKPDLPVSVINLIERIYQLNSTSEAGFRRKNLPSLLTKYFLDMRQVLTGIAQLLKPGAYAYVVVGNNHTKAAGDRVEIETANILGEIAVMVGLEKCEQISMEMLASREIYKENAVTSEVILVLRRLRE
jgi:site-specific DNA-methyltransferase (cytosine-N4-specific)